jgi:hypothetical protein
MNLLIRQLEQPILKHEKQEMHIEVWFHRFLVFISLLDLSSSIISDRPIQQY